MLPPSENLSRHQCHGEPTSHPGRAAGKRFAGVRDSSRFPSPFRQQLCSWQQRDWWAGEFVYDGSGNIVERSPDGLKTEADVYA